MVAQIECEEDMRLVLRLAKCGNPFAAVQMRSCEVIVMFHCMTAQGENIYYLPQNDAIFIAEIGEKMLFLHDIYRENGNDFEGILAAIASVGGSNICLGFTPKSTKNCVARALQEENTHLFILQGLDNIFCENKIMLPTLCRTQRERRMEEKI